ncbi:MAG: hypothetical protein KJ734_08270 [Chloroflexi bacterium]|nr:hypothetical protein [Chloroflexota bacterium]
MKIFRSLTFWLGVGLAVTAFCAFLFLGRIFNPPPTPVVVLTQDVPRYGVITRDALGLDAQTLHPDLARAYVQEHEVDDYLGAVAVEPLYQGDPLTKARLVAGEQAAGLSRLALQLDQADQVAMVIPVQPDTCPGGIRPGDYVNVEFTLGQVRQETGTGAGVYGMATPTPFPEPGALVTTTRTITVGTHLTATVPWSIGETELPLAKTVLQQLRVLEVVREQEPNPQYGMDAPGSESTQPAYVAGDVIGLVVAVPRDAQELLAFSIDNGTVHIALVSHLALQDPDGSASTLGITWADLQAYIRAERLRALGLTASATGTLPAPAIAPTHLFTGSIPGPGTVPATPVPTPTATLSP